MILVKLFLTFAKIGLLGFGGGYAMIPLIQDEIARNNWLTPTAFTDIIAVSQMTPGPIGVNAATFIGIRTAGFPGALAATIGLLIPSLIIVSIVAHMVERFNKSVFLQGILSGIRPAAIGLIGSAVMFFATVSIFTGDIRDGEFAIDWRGFTIFLVILILAKKFKIHPIYCIICSAILGIILYVWVPMLIGNGLSL